MEKREDVVFMPSKPDLDDIEYVVCEPYHRNGSGRLPRNPMAIFDDSEGFLPSES